MPIDSNSQYKELETISIPKIEIFSEGVWNGDSYSHDDLQAMVDAFGEVGFEPIVKAGHAEGQEDEKKARMVFGAPSLGYAKRIWIEGKKLFASLKQVPKHFAALVQAGAFKRISAEIYWSYKNEASGKKFPRVLKAIAFLGAEIPALTDLKAIESLYQRNAAGGLFAYDERGNEFRSYDNMETMGPVSPMYPKKDKVAVNYQAVSANGAERCSTCKFYLHHSCALVEGEIAPEAYCDLYEARNYQIDENRLLSRVKEMIESALSIFKRNGEGDLKNYTIEKRGDEYCLISGAGKTLGCHKTREGALAQERAVQANKNEMLVTAKQMEGICQPCAEKMRQKSFSAIKLLPLLSEDGALTYAFPGGMPQAAFEALCEKFSPDEGFRTRCMDSSAAGNVDDPGAFCNALKTACKDQDLLSSEQPAKEYAMKIVEKDGQHCVMDGEDVVKCYPTRKEAEQHVEKMSKEGGPKMDAKEYEKEKKRLEDEKDAAEKKARQFEQDLAALKASTEEAKTKESEALKEVKKLKRERHDDQVKSWIAEQKRAGKIAPVEEPRLTAIFEALYEDERVVTFSQADGKETREVKQPLADAVKAFIVGRPSIFKELSRATEEEAEPLDNTGDEVDRKTKEHMAKTGMKIEQYAEAMKAVLALKENEDLARRWVRMDRQ